MRRTRTLSFLFLLAWIGFGFTRPPQIQSAFDVSGVGVAYNFGQQITFTARLMSTSGSPITQAAISFRDINEQNTRVEQLTINPDGTTMFQYNAAQNVLAPFATIVFSYQVAFANGQTAASVPFYFRYEDNRFSWKSLTDGTVTVRWYNGGDTFGRAALDAARVSLRDVGQLLSASLDAPLDVYVYANAGDLQSALTLGGKQWVAGHADPALSVVMVSVSPGDAQTIELQRQVPHELAHVMLYRSIGAAGYDRLPAWLNEGIASMAELYPNPDYARALALASQNNSLMPIADLCASFPSDSGGAFLAYAQSESFARYLRSTYGDTGLIALTKSYGDGLDCNLGAMRAIGAPLDQLDARWRESALGQNVIGVAARNLLPYIILLALILVVPIWGALAVVIERKRNERKQ
ncbi:MAG: hypothetical protein HYR93_07660 [Chloroflexi bacterium]|nr:hypothetical protein [Chloroflexota bacterium]